jgi:hypothetical protein
MRPGTEVIELPYLVPSTELSAESYQGTPSGVPIRRVEISCLAMYPW